MDMRKTNRGRRWLVKGSLLHKAISYLDDNGLATAEELAEHLGIPEGQVRKRLTVSAMQQRGRGVVIERVYALTEMGRDLLRGEA